MFSHLFSDSTDKFSIKTVETSFEKLNVLKVTDCQKIQIISSLG